MWVQIDKAELLLQLFLLKYDCSVCAILFGLQASIGENIMQPRRRLLHVRGVESLSCFIVVQFSRLLINAQKCLREEIRMLRGRYYCVLKACASIAFWVWHLECAVPQQLTHTFITTKRRKIPWIILEHLSAKFLNRITGEISDDKQEQMAEEGLCHFCDININL